MKNEFITLLKLFRMYTVYIFHKWRTNMKNKSMNVIKAKVDASLTRSRLTYDFGFGDENGWFVIDSFHAGGVGHHVGAHKATVKRKAFYHFTF